MTKATRATWIRYTLAALALLCCLRPGGSLGRTSPLVLEPASSGGSRRCMRAYKSPYDWQLKKEQNGMTAEVAADAQTPDGPARATLSFQCAPGKGGTSTVEFIVLNAVKLKGFDFDEFEGPDAPAQRRPLVTLTVHRASGDLVIRTACTGFYTVSDEGFAFEVTTMANVHGKVSRLSDALIQGATSISIRIRGLKHPQKVIQATFPTVGAASVLGQVMQDCGKR